MDSPTAGARPRPTTNFWEGALDAADGDRVAAATALAVGLMRSDAATCKAGYTLEAALDAIQTLITIAADAPPSGHDPGWAARTAWLSATERALVATVAVAATNQMPLEAGGEGRDDRARRPGGFPAAAVCGCGAGHPSECAAAVEGCCSSLAQRSGAELHELAGDDECIAAALALARRKTTSAGSQHEEAQER